MLGFAARIALDSLFSFSAQKVKPFCLQTVTLTWAKSFQTAIHSEWHLLLIIRFSDLGSALQNIAYDIYESNIRCHFDTCKQSESRQKESEQ